jgi:NAD-dependent dihydropyrimidine dehydrogenase PreA subunit/flavodoxin
LTALYFSGTGNTKFCAEKFMSVMGGGTAVSIESPAAAQQAAADDDLLLAYPVYYSDMPMIMRDFILKNKGIFNGKNVFILCTMTMFSGDGAGCAARLLKKLGANITGGLHIKMPDVIADMKLFKKDKAAQKLIIRRAAAKIQSAAKRLKQGSPAKDGLSFAHHVAGLLVQRIWCQYPIRHYAGNLKINRDKCVGCRACVSACPMANIRMENGRAAPKGKCTRCYRCVNLCPAQAITLAGKRVVRQKKPAV